MKRGEEIVMILVFASIIAISIASFVKKPLETHKLQRYKRQLSPGYFFAKNVSFGLEPPPPGAEFGPWGPWTESSECSRTCGGGISYQDRICLDVRTDGRHSCIGASRRYFSCSIQDCPDNAKDFREEQCARFNTVPYEGKYYGWLPYLKGQNPCELNCMPRGGRFYTRLARKVIDGTRCYDDGSLDVCVDGICMPVGCNMILGSTAKEDECRECGGDGSSCQIVKGVFDKDNFETGYNDILLIPTGATSIFIKELHPTNNYLAIRNTAGEFYLNGYWRIEHPRDLKVAGTIFHYERKPHGYQAPESLRAKGPTTEPIFIVLLYQAKNLGVSYEYSIPIGVSTARPDTYSWTFGDFEECSQTCGGGIQHRPVRCVRSSDRTIMDESLCDPTQKPPMNATCNTQPCPAKWHIGDWSNCSEPCGVGTQFRLVFCQQVKVGNSSALLPDSMCEEPKPLFMRTCNEATECPLWVEGEWSECNKTCGQGYKTREVLCRRQDNDETLDSSLCKSDTKPMTVEECTNGPCEGVEWILSDWSGCEGLCSPRMESREAHCANEEGIIFPDSACEASRLPELVRSCPVSSMCEPMWHASEWTECSVDCGTGVQTRVVFCGVWEDESVIKINESKCVADKRFEDVQNCSSTSCEGVWFTGPWNRCTSPCGGGERTRKVLCFHENDVVNDSHCDHNEKPFEEEPCNMMPCDDDEIMAMGGCKDLENGCCPDGTTPAGVNFEGCPRINITSNVTCDDAEFGCCADNFTLALGPYKKGCPSSIACNDTKYGCCPDLEIAATGPDFEGCPKVSNCSNSTFGCCPDGFTTAEDENLGGCNITDPTELTIESSGEECNMTEFGCCEDGISTAMGPGYEGCEEELIIVVPENCTDTKYGCCEDNVTSAKGPMMEGCFDEEGSGEIESSENCNETMFGCCPDNVTIAKGFDNEGCNETTECINSTYGCCPDNVTIAKGFDGEGCEEITDCSNSTYGCCPDNVTLAEGFDGEGCNVTIDCSNSTYGCCPDNVTIAKGFDGEGCNVTIDCSNSTYGCCPDNVTLAEGFNGEGCNVTIDCSNSTYGCCPDNITLAEGFDGEGCNATIDCINSTYGCCPDNVTIAKGFNNEGCNETIECMNSTYGCCPDNITIAKGFDGEGCEEITDCSNSTYGCCPDNVTLAEGFDGEGCNVTIDCSNSAYGCCPDNVTVASEGGCPNDTSCISTEFGCCPDNITSASGPDDEGCEDYTILTTEIPTTTEEEDSAECANTLFGCCPDKKTLALGPNLEGCCFGLKFGCCPDNLTAALGPTFLGCSCHTYPYGCCPDGVTPSQGYRYHGCKCEHFRYGCCQDNITPASGPNFEGCQCQTMTFGCCPDGITPMGGPNGEGCGCISTRYGCCPDRKTTATSADLSGCPCDTLPYGCCSDGKTPARTSDHRDCPCDKQRYGCCLDGRTPARGPNYDGCPCESTRFGCCLDGITEAQGPNLAGCPCESSYYGCCADGFTSATGPNMGGCPAISKPESAISAEVCSLPKDSGPCLNYTVKWFFDVNYGGCSRFWYGGCEGNGNVFSTTQKCEETCVTPEGADACLLPKVVGPCEGKYVSFYYDVGSKSCESFLYSGCLGNNNRFTSKELCEHTCIMQEPMEKVDVCTLQKDEGPCDRPVIQWYYNTAAERCEQFYYGGCKGNTNRFETRASCEQECLPPTIIEEDICRKPKVMGSCSDFRERWYYDSEFGQCHRFYYSGCDGNENNFGSLFECEKRCAKDASVTVSPMEDFQIEFCFLTKDPGPCSSSELRWFYDKSDGVCKEFYYGGCQGNGNRFKSKRDCEAACENSQDICRLPIVKGSCSGSFFQWSYDDAADECIEFLFSGCQGNANRFNNKVDCEQQCGKKTPTTIAPTVADDICSLPQEPGPCSGYFRMWYYDNGDNICKSFVYSGCDGNENRFEKRAACEQRCVKKASRVPSVGQVDTTRTNNEDVCRLSVDPGPCTEAHERWFYDAQSQSCLPFVYKGCGGNKNRFKSHDICYRFCTGIKAVSSNDVETPHIPVVTTTPATTTPMTTTCPPSTCANIQCPFGIEETFDTSGCSTCRCSNPCEAHECPDGSRCSIDIVRTPQGGTRTEPVCRRIHKLGECPAQPANDINVRPLASRDCTDRCRDDADCRGDHKCCNNGCANVCMQAEDVFIPATQPEPARILPGPNVTKAQIGEPAELPCRALGYPKPFVTWWRESTMLPLSSSRYEQMPSYSLLIRSVHYDDQGDYSCQAHNGIGPGATFTVTLTIEVFGPADEHSRPSYLSPQLASGFNSHPPLYPSDTQSHDRALDYRENLNQGNDDYELIKHSGIDPVENVPLSASVSITDSAPNVGSPIQIDCIVHGPAPGPEVGWFFEGSQIFSDEKKEIMSNHTLLVKKAEMSDSGEYTCTARHGESVASSSVAIHVEDSAEDPNCVDSPQFANCEIIVKAKYCNNKYYGRYCCASCKKAGQLHNWPLN